MITRSCYTNSIYHICFTVLSQVLMIKGLVWYLWCASGNSYTQRVDRPWVGLICRPEIQRQTYRQQNNKHSGLYRENELNAHVAWQCKQKSRLNTQGNGHTVILRRAWQEISHESREVTEVTNIQTDEVMGTNNSHLNTTSPPPPSQRYFSRTWQSL